MSSSADAIFVRGASTGERVLLVAHRAAAREESARYRGEPWTPSDEVAPEESVILVAGVGETVMASLEAAREDESGRWWIRHVHVEEHAREVGLGDALMLALASEVARRGGTWIGASAQPGDRSLKNLYERHGLVARTILVGRSVDPRPSE
ncbi:MAG: GNAT family N-acetyltransferase [Actinomycetota bacterium]